MKWGQKDVKRYLKSEHTDTRTDTQTDRTNQPIENIDPEGRCFKNCKLGKEYSFCPMFSCCAFAPGVLHSAKGVIKQADQLNHHRPVFYVIQVGRVVKMQSIHSFQDLDRNLSSYALMMHRWNHQKSGIQKLFFECWLDCTEEDI